MLDFEHKQSEGRRVCVIRRESDRKIATHTFHNCNLDPLCEEKNNSAFLLFVELNLEQTD